jgi:hypothetical protein
MPRLPELTMDTAPPGTRTMMEAQQAMFGLVLNPIKLMGYCPTIAEGQAALARGIEKAGNLSKFNRALQIESNGFCLLKQVGETREDRGREP